MTKGTDEKVGEPGLGRKVVEERFPIVAEWDNKPETEYKVMSMFLEMMKEEARKKVGES